MNTMQNGSSSLDTTWTDSIRVWAPCYLSGECSVAFHRDLFPISSKDQSTIEYSIGPRDHFGMEERIMALIAVFAILHYVTRLVFYLFWYPIRLIFSLGSKRSQPQHTAPPPYTSTQPPATVDTTSPTPTKPLTKAERKALKKAAGLDASSSGDLSAAAVSSSHTDGETHLQQMKEQHAVELAKLQQDLAEAQDRSMTLEKAVKEHEQTLTLQSQQHKEALKQAKSEAHQAKEAKDALQKEFTKVKNDLEQKLGAAEKKSQLAEKKIEAAEKKAEAAEKRAEAAESNGKTSAEIDALKKEVTELKSQLAAKDSAAAQITKSQSEANNREQGLLKQLQGLEKERKEWETRLSKVEHDSSAKQLELVKSLAEAEKRKKESSKRLEELQSQQKKDQEARVEHMKKEHAKELSSLQSDLKNAQQQLAQTTDSSSALTVDKAGMQLRVATLERDLGAAQTELAQVKETHQDAQQAHVVESSERVKELEVQVAHLTKTTDDATKQLAILKDQLNASRADAEALRKQLSEFDPSQSSDDSAAGTIGIDLPTLLERLKDTEDRIQSTDEALFRACEALHEQLQEVKHLRERNDLLENRLKSMERQSSHARSASGGISSTDADARSPMVEEEEESKEKEIDATDDGDTEVVRTSIAPTKTLHPISHSTPTHAGPHSRRNSSTSSGPVELGSSPAISLSIRSSGGSNHHTPNDTSTQSSSPFNPLGRVSRAGSVLLPPPTEKDGPTAELRNAWEKRRLSAVPNPPSHYHLSQAEEQELHTVSELIEKFEHLLEEDQVDLAAPASVGIDSGYPAFTPAKADSAAVSKDEKDAAVNAQPSTLTHPASDVSTSTPGHPSSSAHHQSHLSTQLSKLQSLYTTVAQSLRLKRSENAALALDLSALSQHRRSSSIGDIDGSPSVSGKQSPTVGSATVGSSPPISTPAALALVGSSPSRAHALKERGLQQRDEMIRKLQAENARLRETVEEMKMVLSEAQSAGTMSPSMSSASPPPRHVDSSLTSPESVPFDLNESHTEILLSPVASSYTSAHPSATPPATVILRSNVVPPPTSTKPKDLTSLTAALQQELGIQTPRK